MYMWNLGQLEDILLFVKKYDIPNWFSLVLTLIAWPIILFLYDTRKIKNIPNLEVSLEPGTLTVKDAEYPSLWLTFSNQTGSIVYLSNARLSKCTKHFNVAQVSTRDISEAAYELNFSVGGNLNQRQIILNTTGHTFTAMAMDSSPSKEMLSFKPCLWRRIFKCPKYFCLEYLAMVGKKRYNVSTIY